MRCLRPRGWLVSVWMWTTLGLLAANLTTLLAALLFAAMGVAQRDEIGRLQQRLQVVQAAIRHANTQTLLAEEDVALVTGRTAPVDVDEIDEPQATDDQVDAAIAWCLRNGRAL